MTLTTQIGGVIYLVTLFGVRKSVEYLFLLRLGFFLALYLLSTFLIVPSISPIFGREKIKETDVLKAHSFIYVLLNRNYVHPELNEAIAEIATEFEEANSEIKLTFLDANFPFLNGFPLPPHLSHNDGKKIDVSLIYENTNGKLINRKPTISGYGFFEKPDVNELDQITKCKETGNWHYDFPKYLTLGTINNDIVFSEKGTRNLINIIASHNEIEKLFLEPHLKNRLGLTNSKIRYHGCQAVRHDDHIHFQLK